MELKNLNNEQQGSLYYLSRLILIDSYRKGARTEIRLDGHTSFNGLNGTGKTSLLRLIPLFYGESPNKIVQGGGVNQSFLQHYLPRPTSYIIFEYYRRGLPCMVVIHASKSGEQTCYRFIDQPFTLERFRDDDGEIVFGSDLLRHIVKRREYCSEMITVLSDYRSIIQNTVSKKDYRDLAGRFAFVGSGARLGHIEKIATGMFSRVTNFLDLKRIIVSCIENDAQHIKLQASRSEMERWVKEYRAYKSIMSHAGRMEVLEEANLAREETNRRLHDIHRDFLLLMRSQEAAIAEYAQTILSLDKAHAEEQESNQQALTQISTEIGTAEGTVNDLVRRIQSLDAKQRHYEGVKIVDLQRLVDRIPELERDQRQLEQRHEAVLGESSKIEIVFDRQRNERTTDKQRQVEAQQQKRSPIMAEGETQLREVDKQAANVWQEIESRLGERETRLQEDNEKLNEGVGRLKTAVANPQAQGSYQDAVKQAGDAVEAARSVLAKARQEYQEAERQYADEVSLFNDVDKKVGDLERSLGEERKNREYLLTLASALPGSLLHFLREHRPQWTENIARVVPEELLLRTDLSPALAEETSSLYGISLDLAVIDRPRAADETTLQSEIERSSQAIEQIWEQIKIRRSEQERQSSRVDDAKRQTREIKGAEVKATAQEKAAIAELEAANRALKEDQRQAKQRAQHELDTIEKQLVQNRENLKSLKTARTEEKLAHDKQVSAQRQKISEERDRALVVIDKEIAAIDAAHDEAMQSLQRELDAALAKAGVDTATLQELKNQSLAVQADLRRARENIATVEGWKTWFDSDWRLRPQLVEALDQAKKKTGELRAKKADIQAAGINALKKITQAREETLHRQRETEKLKSFVETRCGKLTTWPIGESDLADAPSSGINQDLLAAEMDRLFKESETQQAVARKEVDGLKRAMFEHPGTTPYNFYEKQRLALGPEQEHGSPFAWVPALREWFDAAAVDTRRLLLAQCRTFSQNISEFRDRLERFNRQVGVFSRDLQDKMSASIQFRQISGISVRLATSFDSVEGWTRIKGMADAYGVWAGMEGNELPPDEFADAVDKVGGFLQGRHTVEVRLEDLISLEIDIDEAGQSRKTVKDETQLKDASSTGLSYLILCVVFVGLVNKIRGKQAVTMVWALDELRDLDIGNVESLLSLLTKNNIHLVSAYPDPDPDILSLFKHRYEVLEGRKIASFRIAQEGSHV